MTCVVYDGLFLEVNKYTSTQIVCGTKHVHGCAFFLLVS